jgi:hypothetical protein
MSNAVKSSTTVPIPLEREEPKALLKHEALTMKLRTVPAQADSPTYELTIPYFKSGKPEELLEFIKRLRRVFVGQGLNDGPSQYTMARRLLDGDALAAFNAAAAAAGNETAAHMLTSLNGVISHVFPLRALQAQKRYMRRHMRKPRDMTMRVYVTRVQEINGLLDQFPPFAPNQALADDELIEILEFAIPKTWQKQMIKQNFDPQANTIAAFVQFCERMESTEELENSTPKGESSKGNYHKSKSEEKKKKYSSSSKNKRGSDERSGSDNKKYCMLHGLGSHTTDDCLTLKNQAKRMKGAYNSVSTEGKKKFKQREELHNLVMKQVEKALMSKKGKAAKAALEEYHFDDDVPTKESSDKQDDEAEDFNMDDFSLSEDSSHSSHSSHE